MTLIQQGIEKGLIKFDEENKYITYVHQNKKRNYNNPEEQVQVETFLKLILVYGYHQKLIQQFVSVTMGSSVREADIIVYKDDKHKSPHIVVECKKQEVSELEFQKAVDQGFSYAVAEGAKYVWITSGIKDEYYQVPLEKPKERITITDIPQFGTDTLAKYKYAKGGNTLNGQKLFELEVVTEDELTRRFKQAHQSLWGGGELNPSEAFDELDKLIFCKIWDEKKPRKKGDPYHFQILRENSEDETNQTLYNRIKALYEEGRKKDPEVFKDDIRLSPEKLRTVVGYLESINLSDTDLDSKGRAFETFLGSFFRGDFGQYFTPRAIVKFIVDTLPINHNSLVLDTSCGSGGFLLHALDKVRTQATGYYPDYQTNPKEFNQHYKHWHDFAENNLFGIEISEQIARTAKMNMIIHDDGHTNVIAADGLRDSADLISKTNNHGFAYNRFDFIITNPPFGSIIKQTEQAYMNNYGFAMKAEDWLNPKNKATPKESQNTEVLFIEQCHKFLNVGGYLAVVLPDGILTNSSLQYIRDGIEEKYRIVAVVSLPQTAFSATGAGVKSSVLFLKKHSQFTTEKIHNLKINLQENIKQRNEYLKQLKKLENEKNQYIKELCGFDNLQGLKGKALNDSEAYKEWKKEVNAEYTEKIEALRESLTDQYFEEKQQIIDDYPIFMAIAEEIGYDATGKPTNNNELDFISQELARFIVAIEEGNDSFFFLNYDLDKNKIFLVNYSELAGRIDSIYYSMIKDELLPSRTKYQVKKLGKIADLSRGKFSHRPRNDPRFFGGKYPFIQTGNIVEASENNENIKYTQTLNEKGLGVSKLFPPNTILITIAANIGDTAILKYPACFPDSVVAIMPKEEEKDKLSIDYLNYYLKYLKSYLLKLAPQSAQKNINLQQLSPTSIVIPPIEIQNKIVDKMNAIYTDKKHKDVEAQKLLDSIDNYLLMELGIELPEPEENTIHNRIFYRKLSNVSGGRFDCNFYKSTYTNILNNIKRNSYDKLGHIVEFSSETWDQKSYFNITFPYIEIGHIDTLLGELREINKVALEEAPSRAKKIVRGGDILVSTTRPNRGAIIKIEPGNEIFIASSGFAVLRKIIKENTNKMYLFYVLRQLISLKQMEQRSSGGNYPAITEEELLNILIPLPSLEKQTEIADNITVIRNQAKEIKLEAKTDLEKAKKEVEAMILGEY